MTKRFRELPSANCGRCHVIGKEEVSERKEGDEQRIIYPVLYKVFVCVHWTLSAGLLTCVQRGILCFGWGCGHFSLKKKKDK